MSATPSLMTLRALCLGLTALSGLAACTDPPDLPERDIVPSEQEPYPELVPIERILGTETPDPEADAEVSDALEARMTNLQARAQRLQNTSGIDSQTRDRLNREVPTD